MSPAGPPQRASSRARSCSSHAGMTCSACPYVRRRRSLHPHTQRMQRRHSLLHAAPVCKPPPEVCNTLETHPAAFHCFFCPNYYHPCAILCPFMCICVPPSLSSSRALPAKYDASQQTGHHLPPTRLLLSISSSRLAVTIGKRLRMWGGKGSECSRGCCSCDGCSPTPPSLGHPMLDYMRLCFGKQHHTGAAAQTRSAASTSGTWPSHIV